MSVRLTACPECTAPAELTRLGRVDSTQGSVRIVRVTCIRRHVFVLDEGSLRAHAASRDAPARREDLAG